MSDSSRLRAACLEVFLRWLYRVQDSRVWGSGIPGAGLCRLGSQGLRCSIWGVKGSKALGFTGLGLKGFGGRIQEFLAQGSGVSGPQAQTGSEIQRLRLQRFWGLGSEFWVGWA